MISMPSFSQARLKTVLGSLPCSCSSKVGSRSHRYTFFRSQYKASGIPYRSIQAHRTLMAASVVSCSLNIAKLIPVASSTRFIKQQRLCSGPNQG